MAAEASQGPRGLFQPSQLSPRTVVVACVTAILVGLAVVVVVKAPFALGLCLVSAFLATALDHAVEWLGRRGVSRAVGIALVMLAVVGLLVGVGILVVPTLVQQLQALAEQLPDAFARFQHWKPYDRWVGHSRLGQQIAGAKAGEYGSALVSRTLQVLQSALAVVAAMVTVFFVTLFMLIYGGNLVRRWLDEAIPERRTRYERMLSRIYDALGGYIGGLGAIAGLNATFTSTFLGLLGIPYYLPLGILSGIFSLVPVIGASLAGVLITTVAFAAKGLWFGVGTAAYYLVYQQVENHVFAPLIYRRTVQVNPLLAILAVLFLTELAGLAGALVAVPLLAIAQIVFHELSLLRRSRLGLTVPDNHLPASVPGSRVPPERTP